jgi:ABC-type nitrate/sulfonate/bicarbonate transport system substrate-binding protein
MTSPFAINRRDMVRLGGVAAAGALLGSTGARAQTADTLKFQLSWIKSIQYGGYFAALDQGFYSKLGVDAQFNSGGPNMDAVANVASGNQMMGDRPVGALLVARDKGIPIKVIGTVFQKSPFCIMSLASKPLRTMKDMAGKTIAVPTGSRPLMINLLRDSGMEPSDVNIVPSAPDPSALATGQVDGYAGYSTNQGVMLQTRGVEIFALNVQDLGVPETVGTLYAREDFLAANRDLVVRFLKASAAGWDWAMNHPDETAHLMVDKYGAPGLDYVAQDTEVKASTPYIRFGVGVSHGLLALDLPLFDKIISVYRKAGLVTSNMTVDQLCDASFVNAALTS